MSWKCCFPTKQKKRCHKGDRQEPLNDSSCPENEASQMPAEAGLVPSPSQGIDDKKPWKNTERTISLLPPKAKPRFGAVKQPRRASSDLPPSWPGKWNNWNTDIVKTDPKTAASEQRPLMAGYHQEDFPDQASSSQLAPEDVTIEESTDQHTFLGHKSERSTTASRRPLSASSKSGAMTSAPGKNGRPQSAGGRSGQVRYKDEKVSKRVSRSHLSSNKKRKSSITKYLPTVKQKKIPARRGEQPVQAQHRQTQESALHEMDDTPLESKKDKYAKKRSFMVHGMTVVKTSDNKIEVSFDSNDQHIKKHPDLIDDVMLTLVSARERFSLDAEDIGGIIKNLEPLYRRRIFIQQLKSRWYLVLALLLLLIGTGGGLLYFLGQTPPSIPSPKFRPPPAMDGKLKVLSAEGLNMDYYAREWGSNISIQWSKEVLSPLLRSFFENTNLPIQNITIENLTFSEEQEREKRQAEGRFRNTPKPVVISYVVNPSENETEYYGSELQINALIRSLRKTVFRKKTWKVDPKIFSLRQGNTSVNASTAQQFLARGVPPLDLFSEEEEARSAFLKTTKDFDCEELLLPNNGVIEPLRCMVDKKHQPGVVCTFSCTKNTTLRGSETRVCLNNGVWSGSETDCVKPCQVVAEIPNGVIIPPKCTDPAHNNTIPPDTRCLYTCNTNYALVGALQRVCQNDGTWSSSLPVCKRECPILKPPAFGQMSPPSCFKELSKEGDVCTFACDDALVLQGESATSCDSDGRWTEDVPVCRRKCITSNPVMNADVHPDVCSLSVLYEGMSCTYTCHDGFRLVGNSVRFCTTDESWSATAPQCLRTCPKLKEVLQGSITPISCVTSGAVAWERCTFSCDAGYVIEGHVNLTCIDNGQWDYDVPICLAECPQLKTPTNGVVSCSGVTEGSSCVLHCLSGYRIRGSSFVVCQTDGSWTEPIGTCIGTCKKIEAPLHGSVVPPECAMVDKAVNDTCTFSCDYSYEFSGSTKRTCLVNESWSGVPTSCNVKRQYLFVLDVDLVDVCLTSPGANSISPVKKNFKICEQDPFNLWSLHKDRLLRNSGNGKCIGFEDPVSMAELTFLECNESDSRQILDWPSTTKDNYTVKIRDYELYLWYGYGTAPQVISINKYLPLTGWLLYDPDRKAKTTFFGASNNGRCPQLSDIPNGGWFPLLCGQGPVSSEVRCTFVCAPGYDVIEGEPVATCMSGLWEGNVAPICVRSCVAFSPYFTRYGGATPSYCTNDAYVKRGSTCTFFCLDSYELIGEQNSACLVDGQWSAPQPQCQKRCPPIVIPPFGKVASTLLCPEPLGLHEVGNECTLDCVEGYVVNGSRSIFCKETGEWNDTSYECIRSCVAPISPYMGTASCNETLDSYPHGSECTFMCNGTRSMWPPTANTTKCLDTGTWDIKPPECQEFCPFLTPIANGDIFPSACLGPDNLHNGMKCTYVCNLQYTLSDVKDIICLASASWSASPPTCKPDLHFNFIHLDNSSNQECIVVKQYPHHNTHIVSTKPQRDCLNTNSTDMWSFTTYNQIRSASTGWCLGVAEKKEAEVVKLLDCDGSDEKQRWDCVFELGENRVKLKNTNFVLRSKNSFLYITQMADLGSWETLDEAATTGRICGMQPNQTGTCSKITMPPGGTVSLSCHNAVPIASTCSITCDANYVLESGSTTVTATCNQYGIYDTTDIYCRKRECIGITTPVNGQVSSVSCNSRVQAWSTTACTVTCTSSAFLSIKRGASGTLFCLGNGMWSEPVPLCLSFCPALTKPTNGDVNPETDCTTADSSKHGDICVFTCQVHYKLIGSSSLLCTNGAWNGTEPVCQLLSGNSLCSRLQAPNFGYVTPTRCLSGSVPVNVTCTASCLPGFSAIPLKHDKSICQPDGTWSSPLSICKKVCNVLIAPRHSSLQPAHCSSGVMTEGHICRVVCANGYALTSDVGILTCRYDGQWDVSMPRCEPVPQFTLQVASRCASVTNEPESWVFAATCSVNDDKQRWEWYDIGKIRNVATQMCMAPESVTSYSSIKLADCKSINSSWECPYAPSPADYMTFSDRYIVAYATATTPNILFIIDTSHEDQSWKSQRSTEVVGRNTTVSGRPCAYRKRTICPPLPAISYGFIQAGCAAPGFTIIVGTKCAYSCRSGYTLVGIGERTCLKEGRWSDMSLVKCKRQCSVLPMPAFATVSPGTCATKKLHEGSACTFGCNQGYDLAGTNRRVCRPDGSWSNVPVICHKKCKPLVLPGLLAIEPSRCMTDELIMGSLCTAHCPNGYELFGSTVRTCKSDGSWSGDYAECLRSCPAITPISNGRIMPLDCIGGGKKSGDTCVFSCESIYSLKGVRIHTCSPDGLWSGERPTCLRTCQSLNPPTNGFVKCERKIPLVGDVCEYSCLPDYVISDAYSDKRTCLNTSLWSGDAPICIREHQFLLLQTSPPNTKHCLHVNAKQSIGMRQDPYCDFYNGSDRWAWYKDDLIRHSTTRRCLAGYMVESAGSYLILKDCNASDPAQIWECGDPNLIWFIRLTHSQKLPLYSILAIGKVLLFTSKGLTFVQSASFGITTHTQWHAKTSLAERIPVCSAKKIDSCPGLYVDIGTLVTPSGCRTKPMIVGTECHFTCTQKFKLNLQITFTECLKSGHWSHEVPKCIPACEPFKISPLSTLQISPPSCAGTYKHAEGFACKFSCPINYRLIGNTVLTCQRNSAWNFEQPHCKATCPAVNHLIHGSVTPEECTDSGTRVLEGTLCRYECLQTEHILSGVSQRVCTKLGRWSDIEPRCIKPCPIHLPPEGGSVIPPRCASQMSVADTVCAFKCGTGLIQLGSAFRICLANGTWSEKKPQCQSTCPVILSRKYSVLKPSSCGLENTAPGHSCHLNCNPGFEKKGNEVVSCNENGTWSGYLGECIQRCPKVKKPMNGQALPQSCLGGELFEGHECTFSCENGYLLRGSDVRACKEDGTWSGNETFCDRACSPLRTGLNMYYEPINCENRYHLEGSTCRAMCDEGTVTRDGLYSSLARCGADGDWDSMMIEACHPACPTPIVFNGETICTTPESNLPTSIHAAGVICTTTCNEDYIVTSPPISKCVISAENVNEGYWFPTRTQCTYEPDPMIIINRLNFTSVCLGVKDGRVVLVQWPNCRNETYLTQWVWQGKHLIRNAVTGLCISVPKALPHRYVATSICNSTNPFQQWDCSRDDPFGVVLRGTEFSISTAIKEIDGVVITIGNKLSSRLYTYNPYSENEVGTLCSRRRFSTCSLPDLPRRAQFSPTCLQNLPTESGSQCTILCSDTPNNLLTCQEDGTWLPGIQTICQKPCPRYADLENIAIFLEEECYAEKVPQKTVCTLGCPRGYVLLGEGKQTQCTNQGIWKRLEPYECKIACTKISELKNGVLTPKECITGTCAISCNPGYRIDGPKTRTCEPSGLWSDREFECVAEVQFSIISITKYKQHALCLEVSEDLLVYKQACIFSKKSQRWRWNSHYTIENVVTEKCLAINFNAASKPEAIINPTSSDNVNVGTDIPPTNQTSNQETISPEPVITLNLLFDDSLGTKVVIKECSSTDRSQRWTCGSEEDLFLQLVDQNIFLDSGPIFRANLDINEVITSKSVKWVGVVYTEERNVCAFRYTGTCTPLEDIFGGIVSPPVCKSSFVVSGTRCVYSCNGDFTLEGDEITTCTNNGKWSRPPPFCLGMGVCPPLISPRHLLISPVLCTKTVVAEGHLCYMKCDENTVIQGERALLCGPGGVWNGSLPKCNSVCPALHPPDDGTILPRECEKPNVKPSVICKSSCNENFTMVGKSERRCLEDGTWDGEQLLCKMFCPALPLLQGGDVTPTECLTNKSAHGVVCEMTCSYKSFLSGQSKLVCNEGNWTSDMPTCVPDWCPRLQFLPRETNAIYYEGLINGAVVQNSVLRIRCLSGYATKFPPNRVCLKNKEWSSGNGTCKQIHCPFLTRLYHGEVTPKNCTGRYPGVPVGLVCFIKCSTTYVLVGPSSKECLLGGVWSDSARVECQDTHQRSYTIMFSMVLTKQLSDGNVESKCLQVTRNTKSTSLTTCRRNSPYQSWRWFGSSRIQNLASQLCLTMTSGWELILDICTLNKTSQDAACGDISSIAGHLRLSVGGVLVGEGVGTTTSRIQGLKWSASWISFTSRVQVMSRVSSDEFVPICTYMCGGNFTSAKGDLSSPNYPNPYPSDVECIWVIQTNTPKHELQIDFSYISLESENITTRRQRECAEDILRVSEGNGIDGNELVKRCSSNNSFRVMSLFGPIRINFFSNNNNKPGGYGFSAHWNSIPWPKPREECGDPYNSNPVSLSTDDTPSAGLWQTFVVYMQKDLCNAFIISSYFVITNAHCVESFHNKTGILDKQKIFVLYGFSSQDELIHKFQKKAFNDVRKIWLHPSYFESSLKNDLALIMTHYEIEQDWNVGPICMPDLNLGNVAVPGHSHCWAVQWTRNAFSEIKAEWDFTRYSYVRLLTNARCFALLRRLKQIEELHNLICAEEVEEKVTVHLDFQPYPLISRIENDEGNLLQCQWNSNWYLTAVHSFTLETRSNRLFVFTNLKKFQPWIDDITYNAFYYLRENAIL